MLEFYPGGLRGKNAGPRWISAVPGPSSPQGVPQRRCQSVSDRLAYTP